MSKSEGNSSESSARRFSGVRFNAELALAKESGAIDAALKGSMGSPRGSSSEAFGTMVGLEVPADGLLDVRSTMPTVAWVRTEEFFPSSFCFFCDSKSFASWLS